MKAITHSASGWTRTATGHGHWRITPTPTDGGGERIVAFLSAGSWANLPADSRDRIEEDRVVLVSGAPLPAWAMDWLTYANVKQCERGRQALRAAIEDADWNEARRDFGEDW